VPSLGTAIDIFSVIGAIVLTAIGALMIKPVWLKVAVAILGTLTAAAGGYAAYSDQTNQAFIKDKLTGEKSRCLVEAKRFDGSLSDNPLMLWATNQGVSAITPTVIAMHGPEGIGYAWRVIMPEPCTSQAKAIHAVGLGKFYLEIDDTQGLTTYETLEIEKRGNSFHQTVTISGKWSFKWENDF